MLSDHGTATSSSKALRLGQVPLAERSPNAVDTPLQTSKKRKAVENCDANNLGETILVHPCNPVIGEPAILKPRRLIRRSSLPLSCLSMTSLSVSSEGSPLFSAYIWALETGANSDEHEEIQVLLAECIEDRRVFAIERVERGIYALCGLAKWVSLDGIGRGAVKKPRTNLPSTMSASRDKAWWKGASITSTPSQGLSDFPTQRPVLRLSMKHRLSTAVEPSTIIGTTAEAAASEGTVIASPNLAPVLLNDQAQKSADSHRDAVADLKTQYLEALYLSKAPLAYFVKGPLSRARAEQHSAGAAVPEVSSLLEVLRSSILPVKERGNIAKIDRKYTNAIPELVREIPPGSTIEDEQGQLKTVFADRIKKSKKRKKINSDGVLPGEEEYILKWWINRETIELEGGGDETLEKRIRTACQYRKPREMQLQTILILEVLALERQTTDETLALAPGPQGEKTVDSVSQAVTKKDKKPTDFSKTLDILLEKLQIWETTNQDIFDLGKEGKLAGLTTQQRALEIGAGSGCLRSFCTDVVIPFYAPRVPDIAKSVCQKLGAAIPSPPKKQLTRSSSSGKLAARPGAPVRHRRPLARVLTEDNTVARKPSQALARSTTDSSLPVIKQEFEEDTLASATLRRQNFQQTRRYTQREVDLAAEAKATEAKLKRKVAIEQEIKGAINTLKRPNARMAVKEFVEASDHRHVTKSSKSRKPQNPIYNPFALGVQVMATPKAIRHRHVKAAANTQPTLQISEPREPEAIPPSSDPRIPSSSHKPPTLRLSRTKSDLATSHPARQSALALSPKPKNKHVSIEATPSRPRTTNHLSHLSQASRLASLLEAPESASDDELSSSPRLPELPKPKRPAASAEAAFKRPSPPPQPLGEAAGSSLAETPAKIPSQRLAADVVAGTPSGRAGSGGVVPDSSPPRLEVGRGERREEGEGAEEEDGKGGQEREKSIYEALGWDVGVEELGLL